MRNSISRRRRLRPRSAQRGRYHADDLVAHAARQAQRHHGRHADGRRIGGIDYYLSDTIPTGRCFSARRRSIATTCRKSVAFYWQQTVTVLPTTDVSAGARVQRHPDLQASGMFDPNAPGGSRCRAFRLRLLPDGMRRHSAGHRARAIGPIISAWSIASRRKCRGVRAHGAELPRPQRGRACRHGDVAQRRSRPSSICARRSRMTAKAGCAFKSGPFDMQSSLYDMRLTDEIHFRFAAEFREPRTSTSIRRSAGAARRWSPGG